MSLRDEIKEFKSMKRLLILVLALTLCFAGCKEEPKMPDTPEVEHTEEVKAPVEETPTEPVEKIPDKPKVEKLVEENHTYIFSFDFDGFVYDFSVELPRQYVTPTLVASNNFDWGEYFPIVTFTVEEGEYVEQYFSNSVLLTPETKSLTNKTMLNEYNSFIEMANNQYNVNVTTNYDKSMSPHINILGFFDNNYFIANIFFPNEFTTATYLFDLKKSTAKLLITQANTASVSPDGKYIVYSSPFADEWSLSDAEIEGEIEQGFYVKNIETEETIFYSCKDICNPYCAVHSIKGWLHVNNLHS